MAERGFKCLICSYDLAGIDLSAPCPECGAAPSAAREHAPLTWRTWSISLTRTAVSPLRSVARTSGHTAATTILFLNMSLGWMLIAVAALLPALIEELNDERRDGAGMLAVFSLAAVMLPSALIGGSLGLGANAVGFAITEALAAGLAWAGRRRLRRPGIESIRAGASYAVAVVGISALAVSLVFSVVGILWFDGAGSPVSWFTGASILYVGLPAAGAAVIVSCALLLWGLLAVNATGTKSDEG